MRSVVAVQNSSDAAAVFLEFEAHEFPQPKVTGKKMTTRTVQNAGYPISKRSQGVQDIPLVSPLGLEAALLGLTPVLAFRMLLGS